jgi:hypothetical protein
LDKAFWYSYGWLLALILFPKFLLRHFTLGIGKAPSKFLYWTRIQWYFTVVLSLLPLDKPPLVIGVGRWLCVWVVLPKLLLRPFTLGIDKPPPKSFHWTWYCIVALSLLPQDKPPLVIGVGRQLSEWVVVMVVLPKFYWGLSH